MKYRFIFFLFGALALVGLMSIASFISPVAAFAAVHPVDAIIAAAAVYILIGVLTFIAVLMIFLKVIRSMQRSYNQPLARDLGLRMPPMRP